MKNNILSLYPELNNFMNFNNLPKVDPNWLAGFSDGESSFYITIVSSGSTRLKSGSRA